MPDALMALGTALEISGLTEKWTLSLLVFTSEVVHNLSLSDARAITKTVDGKQNYFYFFGHFQHGLLV